MSTDGESAVEVSLDLESGYRFLVDFGLPSAATMLLDEPEPLGEGLAPNASRALAAAVGNCLSASLLFCLRRAHVDVHSMHTTVRATLVRNERGRLRVGPIEVTITPEIEGDASRMARCVELFEDYCVVTDAVRDGLPVSVHVAPGSSLSAEAGTVTAVSPS